MRKNRKIIVENRTIQDWINSFNIKQLGSFLGIIGWYQTHYHNYFFLDERNERHLVLDLGFSLERNKKWIDVDELKDKLITMINSRIIESRKQCLLKVASQVFQGYKLVDIARTIDDDIKSGVT